MTARVRRIDFGIEGRQTVGIELDWTTAGAREVDALILAEQCVADWTQILADLNIVER